MDYVDYFDIAWRSDDRGRETREGSGKQTIFEVNVSISRKR